MSRPIWKNPLAILLAASLGLNLFIGARVVGRHLPSFGAEAEAHRGPREAIGAFLSQASQETRDRFQAMRRASRESDAERRAKRSQAREAVAAAIEAEPFDPERLETALVAVSAADHRGPRADRFAAFVRDTPAVERAILAAELRKIRRPHRDGRRD